MEEDKRLKQEKKMKTKKSFVDTSKIDVNVMVKFAKALAKKNKDNWIEVYTEIIMWSMVNMIDKDKSFWLELKEIFVDNEEWQTQIFKVIQEKKKPDKRLLKSVVYSMGVKKQ